MGVRLRPLLTGLVSFIPGVHARFSRGIGETHTAEYCYEIWLKHLLHLTAERGHAVPRSVAEIGPGDSVGVGLAALLCGAESYAAVDVRRHGNLARNLQLLEEIQELLAMRAPVPVAGWPDLRPYLDRAGFPRDVLTDDHLARALAPQRVQAIRDALTALYHGETPTRGIRMAYVVPWDGRDALQDKALEFVFSQSVMEHVPDPAAIYGAIRAWLAPGGVTSHQIDFRSHNLTRAWNGHWACPDPLWALILGRRDFLLNRQPCSAHVRTIQATGFRLLRSLMRRETSGIRREQLAPRWREMSDEDLHCSGLFLQAVKA